MICSHNIDQSGNCEHLIHALLCTSLDQRIDLTALPQYYYQYYTILEILSKNCRSLTTMHLELPKTRLCNSHQNFYRSCTKGKMSVACSGIYFFCHVFFTSLTSTAEQFDVLLTSATSQPIFVTSQLPNAKGDVKFYHLYLRVHHVQPAILVAYSTARIII